MIDNKVILITGGTGSFGSKFIAELFQNQSPAKVIVFSRDEFKQHKLSMEYSPEKYPIRFFLGDIRDEKRLRRAFEGVDIVVHAAALKHVPSSEYNPFEAVKTNILGAQNVINAAIDTGVKKVIAISTDKAVSPANLYGASKLVMEKLFIAGNAYTGSRPTTFSAVRYGNVCGSRGSVIEHFMSLKEYGIKEFPVTDERMTRYWITLKQAVDFVISSIKESVGGEIFVPKIPSMKIVDLVKAIEPACDMKVIGIRPGEKLHERLISEDESRNARVLQDRFVILPQFACKDGKMLKYDKYPFPPDGFIYSSDNNDWWLSSEQLLELIQQPVGSLNLKQDILSSPPMEQGSNLRISSCSR